MSSSKKIGKKFLSVLSSAALAASCLALMPTAPALAVEAAGESSYIFHDTFESGTDNWSARGSCNAAVSSNATYKGSKALYLSGRTAAWNGGQKSLSTTTFVPGRSYAFSACFANLTGSDTIEFKLTL